jgi:hypothetical protein
VDKTPRRHRAQTLLQWVFSRGNNLVTCELAQEGSRYCVRLFPHGGLRKALVASFDAGLSAFQGHAALAAELRRSGWMLVAYR